MLEKKARAKMQALKTAYMHEFRRLPPAPDNVSDDVLAVVLDAAIRTGVPVPEGFDWAAYKRAL